MSRIKFFVGYGTVFSWVFGVLELVLNKFVEDAKIVVYRLGEDINVLPYFWVLVSVTVRGTLRLLEFFQCLFAQRLEHFLHIALLEDKFYVLHLVFLWCYVFGSLDLLVGCVCTGCSESLSHLGVYHLHCECPVFLLVCRLFKCFL